MRRAWPIAVAVVLVAVLGAGAVAAALGTSPGEGGPTEALPTGPGDTILPGGSDHDLSAPDADFAAAFLDDWVEDGRVIRRDQGGDTVSEGQAYGMLIAVAAGREDDFDAIWSWTVQHLQRPDGLLSWRWAEGGVVDDEPASDAELDAARALVLAGERFDRSDLVEDGVHLGTAMLDEMTVTTDVGRILLPGLWSAPTAPPYVYNPSYASPAAFEVLADASGDPRWVELREGSLAVTETLLDGTALPPDWAQLQPDGEVVPAGGASGSDEVVYGFEATRIALRYAESCDAAEVAAAARMLEPLRFHDELPAVLDLGGGDIGDDAHPLGYLARAAAAVAAGDDAGAEDDIARAADLAEQRPSYYGAAWLAIADAMLRDETFGGCAPLGVSS